MSEAAEIVSLFPQHSPSFEFGQNFGIFLCHTLENLFDHRQIPEQTVFGFLLLLG